MLKKLRNRMLIMNMVSTFILIAVAFCAIFAITHSNLEQEIDQSLNRAFSFQRRRFFIPQQENFTHPSEHTREGAPERVLRDMRNFSVYVESDGTVRTDSIFGENNSRYEAVAKAALSQNSDEGEFKSEGIVWRFKTHNLKNGGKIIALADITVEKGVLVHLIISFSVGAAILLILVFFISLLFANRSIAPVREAWEKQKRFVADASHELRTPLSAINTNVDVLLSQKDKTIASEEKWLTYIKSEADRLSKLTESLLFMAKIDGQALPPMERVSLSDLVESVALNMEAIAFENSTPLNYDIEKDIGAVCNSAQITRLCIILLDNAVKYSFKNSPITVTLKRFSRDSLLLSVHNFSDPIEESEQARIFDRFYRIDESRSTVGAGLGLSMAKEIVQLHKGKIQVKSSMENGTEFSVILPHK